MAPTKLFYYLLMILFYATLIQGPSVSYIQNIRIKVLNDPNVTVTTILNRTCEECLCEALRRNMKTYNVAMNCLLNTTCEFLSKFPVTYNLLTKNNSRLYFLQDRFPEPSSCCMPDIHFLLQNLKDSKPIIKNLTFEPSAIAYDQRNLGEIAIIGRHGGWLYWFNSTNLNYLRNTSIVNSSLALAIVNNSIYTAIDNIPSIFIYDHQNHSLIHTVNHSSLLRVRKLIFTEKGDKMFVTAQANQSISVFNVNSVTNYTFDRSIPFAFHEIQSLAKVNDTFFYASSWTNRSFASYKYQNSNWTARRFHSNSFYGNGGHLAVDECERLWFILTDLGLRIYNPYGAEIGNLPISMTVIFDLLFLPNYVLFVTIRTPPQLHRYDPQVSCS